MFATEYFLIRENICNLDGDSCFVTFVCDIEMKSIYNDTYLLMFLFLVSEFIYFTDSLCRLTKFLKFQKLLD